jgi:hypothetical protein
MLGLDGKEVKVGDRLWSIIHGEVIVTHLTEDSDYPIYARPNTGHTTTFSRDGKFHLSHPNRILFWDEIVFDIPVPPKPKVKKYKLVLRNKFNRMDYVISSIYYEGISAFKTKDYTEQWEAVQVIEDSMIEVEDLNGS